MRVLLKKFIGVLLNKSGKNPERPSSACVRSYDVVSFYINNILITFLNCFVCATPPTHDSRDLIEGQESALIREPIIFS